MKISVFDTLNASRAWRAKIEKTTLFTRFFGHACVQSHIRLPPAQNNHYIIIIILKLSLWSQHKFLTYLEFSIDVLQSSSGEWLATQIRSQWPFGHLTPKSGQTLLVTCIGPRLCWVMVHSHGYRWPPSHLFFKYLGYRSWIFEVHLEKGDEIISLTSDYYVYQHRSTFIVVFFTCCVHLFLIHKPNLKRPIIKPLFTWIKFSSYV